MLQESVQEIKFILLSFLGDGGPLVWCFPSLILAKIRLTATPLSSKIMDPPLKSALKLRQVGVTRF